MSSRNVRVLAALGAESYVEGLIDGVKKHQRSYESLTDAFRRLIVVEALVAADGGIVKAAKRLGLTKSTVSRYVNEYWPAARKPMRSQPSMHPEAVRSRRRRLRGLKGGKS